MDEMDGLTRELQVAYNLTTKKRGIFPTQGAMQGGKLRLPSHLAIVKDRKEILDR